jgi:hypothetical protein
MPRSCVRALRLAALAALAGATPASAETVPYAFSTPCGAFDILVQGQETITERDFPGRVVFDAPFHVVFEGGHHEVLHGDVDALACEAFA